MNIHEYLLLKWAKLVWFGGRDARDGEHVCASVRRSLTAAKEKSMKTSDKERLHAYTNPPPFRTDPAQTNANFSTWIRYSISVENTILNG